MSILLGAGSKFVSLGIVYVPFNCLNFVICNETTLHLINAALNLHLFTLIKLDRSSAFDSLQLRACAHECKDALDPFRVVISSIIMKREMLKSVLRT